MGKTEKHWAAVIGSPIIHSLSPVLHTTAYRLFGLDWDYRSFEVDTGGLADFVAGLDSRCVGLSVTMPCKQELAWHADTAEGLAKATGASNTLVNAGGIKACFNTDVHGIVQALLSTYGQELRQVVEGNREAGARAVILGTGATAASALAALTTLGISEVTVVGRNFQGPGSITLAANRLKVNFEPVYWKHLENVHRVCTDADIVVSTVPPKVSSDLAGTLSPRSDQRLLDVTYSAGMTPLANAFKSQGSLVASPLEMLVHQGLAQVKLMTGREAPFKPVYDAVLAAAG